MKTIFLASALLPILAFARDNPFDPKTSKGTFGPFTPAKKALKSATGAPATVDDDTAQALQTACDNWTADTGKVSNFQNIGSSTASGSQFTNAANIAYKAEVDELTHKAILDKIIGKDPTVSIANQTLTNGVFQSVVDNLQIMSIQGKSRVNLIDTINSVRCTQILPSIDAYCAVVARTIGGGTQAKTAVRPSACAAIVAADTDPADYPNVPNVPGGTALASAPSSSASASAGGNGGSSSNGGNAGSSTGTTGGGHHSHNNRKRYFAGTEYIAREKTPNRKRYFAGTEYIAKEKNTNRKRYFAGTEYIAKEKNSNRKRYFKGSDYIANEPSEVSH
ncbi:hypothetical protein BT63DRAFT_456013 [Microthyrium microscopicum]|uniref:Cell wall protein n=1 Tax=Microthyrium microscopicum TaxID=703497 RepID=A0A6A6UAA5_9PEZI|nr:hypothetical protein BT63DRAFT_456013 [Microthyrium microscopicum]